MGLFTVAGVAFALQAFAFPLALDGSWTSRGILAGYGTMQLLVAVLFLAVYGLRVPRLAAPLVYLGRISYGMYVFHFAWLLCWRKIAQHAHLPQTLAWGGVA